MSDPIDDMSKQFDDLIAQIKGDKPLRMSKTTRRLAQQVLAKRDAERDKVMTPEEIDAWAHRIVYGKDVDSDE